MLDNTTIKITMLGGIKAGKTCFMLGMYSVMQNGVRGFTFTTIDPDQDLDLGDAWARLLDGGAERWPPPNDDNARSYEFDFNYAFQRIMGFEWLDYRGGALRDGADVEDVVELKGHLHDSSAVFLCVSGEYLAEGKDLTYISHKARTSRMHLFLTELLRTGASPPAVVIVLTQYDRCRHLSDEEITETIKKLFNPLFVANGGWLVTIVPVSLGKGLAEDSSGAEIEPKNIHLPVSFAIYQACKQVLASVSGDIEERSEEIQRLGGNLFKDWWNKTEIALEREGRNVLTDHRREIEDAMTRIASELVQGVKIYWNGEEVELDV